MRWCFCLRFSAAFVCWKTNEAKVGLNYKRFVFSNSSINTIIVGDDKFYFLFEKIRDFYAMPKQKLSKMQIRLRFFLN